LFVDFLPLIFNDLFLLFAGMRLQNMFVIALITPDMELSLKRALKQIFKKTNGSQMPSRFSQLKIQVSKKGFENINLIFQKGS